MLIASLLLSTTMVMTRLAGPDFKARPVATVAAKSPVTLTLVSNTANKITDDDAWFAKHELSLNRLTEPPEGVPAELDGVNFISAIRSGDRYLAMYGPDFAGGTLVAGFDDDGGLEFAYDFSSYRYAPRNVESDRPYVEQRVLWADVKGDVMYVSHGHRTYAKSSHGMNAYVTAIDLRSGKPLWHSAPLVANAANFALVGDHLITGYGFTAEPDFLYVLRAKDGAAVAKVPVKSGPSFIIPRGDRIYVRTYDRDYVFRIR